MVYCESVSARCQYDLDVEQLTAKHETVTANAVSCSNWNPIHEIKIIFGKSIAL